MTKTGRPPATLAQRLAARFGNLGRAEERAARFFLENREETLVASAQELAERIGISDATVIRTAKALGFAGMDELRRALADELRSSLSPAARMVRTLGEAGDKPESALQQTVDIHQHALEALRRDIAPQIFQATVERVAGAKRVFIFGVGPSSTMADYFAIQLGRFGIESASLTQTGLLLADGLHRLRAGDLLMLLAYTHVYPEIEALLQRAAEVAVPVVLISDTLGAILAARVEIVLPVARGRADMLSMHTATLGLIEALLVGVAMMRRDATVHHLGLLNTLRAKIVGRTMDLATPAGAHAKRRKRNS